MDRSPEGAAVIQRRLLHLGGSARGPLAATVLLTIGGAIASVAQMVQAAQVVVALFPGTPADPSGPLRLLLAATAARAVLAGLAELSAQRIATTVKSQLRMDLLRHLVTQGPGTSLETQTGELANTVVEGVEKLDLFYRRFLPQAIATAIIPLIVVCAVAWFDPLSAIVLGVTAPLIPVFMWLLGTAAERRARRQWNALSALSGRFLDTLQGLQTLRLFGRGPDAAAAVTAAGEQLRVRTMGVLRVAFLSGFVLELAASISTAVVAAEVGVRLLEGALAFAPGLTTLLLTPEFYLPFRQLGQRHHAAMEGVAAAERIFELLDTPIESTSPTARRAVRPREGLVTVERVSYTYPDAEQPALNDITLSIEPRTFTAIIGGSGAGKSTLLSLLLRFRNADEGTLAIDGRRSDEISPAEWRRQVAYVPQRPHFIHGSILENLRLGNAHAPLEQVIAATRLASADAFITRTAVGYDTVIDENATTLSGGERQRLALARALLKPAPVLVLDEPTASVDDISEALIAAALARVSRERTVIVVAHRPITIRHADVVIVFDSGRIIERRTRGVA